MAVQSAFSADVVVGASPLTVVFTDESTGSPTAWFWEFGDGFVSTEQHPTHIYEDDGAYTVTLKVFISTGSSDVAGTVDSGRFRGSSPPSSNNNDEHDELLAAGWTNSIALPPRYTLAKTSGDITMSYAQAEITYGLDLTAESSFLAYLAVKWDITAPNNPGSGIKTDAGGKLYALARSTSFFAIEKVTSLLGTSFNRTISDINDAAGILPTPTFPATEGWRTNAVKVVVLNTPTSEDTLTKENYIVSGPPIAEFSGDPLSGGSPLSVALTNESLGHITDYSWRKRKSGSGDAFEEFSTEQDPTQDFNKVYP